MESADGCSEQKQTPERVSPTGFVRFERVSLSFSAFQQILDVVRMFLLMASRKKTKNKTKEKKQGELLECAKCSVDFGHCGVLNHASTKPLPQKSSSCAASMDLSQALLLFACGLCFSFGLL